MNLPAAKVSESVLLSLGSNIDPELNLVRATDLLAGRVEVVAASRAFETPPAEASRVPHFLNAALHIHCNLSPRELKFQVLRLIERRLGRIRTADRNAPRPIDLDIALFGQRIFQDRSAGLEIPDRDILTRAHVALPLADVAPDMRHPVTGERLAEIAARFEPAHDIRIEEHVVLWPPSARGS